MSGIEVAGLVLGALPLVISALDAYKAGRTHFSVWRRHGEFLDILISQLRMQEVFFQGHIEVLLKSAGTDSIVIEALKSSNGKLMHSTDGDEDLRDFLGSAYDTLLHVLRLYRGTMESIACKLQGSVDDFNVSCFSDNLIGNSGKFSLVAGCLKSGEDTPKCAALLNKGSSYPVDRSFEGSLSA